MLLALDINSFALIDKLYIEFDKGLNIITGETGAGKSIVVDSINFILGSKFSKDIIKKGREKAEIKAVFDLSEAQMEYAQKLGFECTDSVVSVSRIINSSSKTTCRFNDKIITLTNLRNIACGFMEVHGQHENQVLFNSSNHIGFLDSFAFRDNKAAKKDFMSKFSEFKELRGKILDEKMDARYIAAQMEKIKLELKELTGLKWHEGEEEELKSKVLQMENMENVTTALSQAYNALYSGENCAYERLGEAVSSLEKIKDISETYGDLYSKVSSVYYDLEDAVEIVRDNLKSFEFSPQQLDQMQKRLFEFNRIKRRYGKNEKELLLYVRELKSKYEDMEYNLSHAKELRKQLKELYDKAVDSAKVLSGEREKCALSLENEIMAHLNDLGMKNATFKVDIQSKDLGSTGIDSVEFLFCANKGQELKPLTKVASGGEISRLMLALKNVDLDSSIVNSMVFDEIDTGISGKMAQAVAVKLANIAKRNQVICVTHLPQVSAMGDIHIFVEKTETENDTLIKASRLGEEQRIMEIARLISGSDITESGISHAKELISEGINYKL